MCSLYSSRLCAINSEYKIWVSSKSSGYVTSLKVNERKKQTEADKLEEINAKIQNLETISTTVAEWKEQHQKIVFTNGCFDILHLGHIKYLEKAKKVGDVLIIGINSDASVKRLKGKDRPINNEFDRAYLINSLKTVDYTVIFNEDTPYELIKIIKPDILVKGGDYKNKKVVGSDIVKKTKLIEFIEGKSTTELINKIKKCY